MINHKLSKPVNNEQTLTITVDEQFISPYKQAVIKKLKKDLKVDGFRPGNVPDNIAERELGEAKVQAEVLQEVIMHAYSKVIREQKIETVASPQINLKKFVPYSELEFEAVVAVMPKINLDLTKLKLKQSELKISKQEIENTLKNLASKSAKKEESSATIQKGDEVEFDFEGTKNGQKIEGASAKNHTLTVGEGSFIPGFEENLIGLKKNESKNFEVKFPSDYHAKELVNQKVKFDIKINKITKVTLPKIDDKWAKTVGPVKDLTELKQEVEKTLIQQKQTDLDREYENEVLEKAISLSKVEAPESLVSEQTTRLRSETEQNLKNSGLDIDKYLKLQGQKPEEFDKQLKAEAEKRVKLGLVLRHIIESNNININQTEVDSEIEKLRSQYTDPKMQEELSHEHFISDLRNHLLTQKAVKYLVDTAKK